MSETDDMDPAWHAVTADQVRLRRFRVVPRGYDVDEVLAFMNDAANTIAELQLQLDLTADLADDGSSGMPRA